MFYFQSTCHFNIFLSGLCLMFWIVYERFSIWIKIFPFYVYYFISNFNGYWIFPMNLWSCMRHWCVTISHPGNNNPADPSFFQLRYSPGWRRNCFILFDFIPAYAQACQSCWLARGNPTLLMSSYYWSAVDQSATVLYQCKQEHQYTDWRRTTEDFMFDSCPSLWMCLLHFPNLQTNPRQ